MTARRSSNHSEANGMAVMAFAAVLHIPTRHHHSKSVTIRTRRDGIDLHCFAGCSWEAVKSELQRQGLLDGDRGTVAAPPPRMVERADDQHRASNMPSSFGGSQFHSLTH